MKHALILLCLSASVVAQPSDHSLKMSAECWHAVYSNIYAMSDDNLVSAISVLQKCSQSPNLTKRDRLIINQQTYAVAYEQASRAFRKQLQEKDDAAQRAAEVNEQNIKRLIKMYADLSDEYRKIQPLLVPVNMSPPVINCSSDRIGQSVFTTCF